MDKSWITKPLSSITYQQGIKEFIDFAFKGAKENDVVICPCKRCGFRKSKNTIIVEDPIQNMINDAFGVDRNHANEISYPSNLEIDQEDYVMPSATQEINEAKEYYELAREGEQPLYEGCRRYSRLYFLVKLYL
ncbi:unnamed protein product [Vicia faba]|uniref:Transposase-associated domain-containing protein n=1 Tax=Vicia faba TaxID=3906 RepID=A0AAV1AFK7_VICFA|nr:unnamed protein product [Vicia faba]